MKIASQTHTTRPNKPNAEIKTRSLQSHLPDAGEMRGEPFGVQKNCCVPIFVLGPVVQVEKRKEERSMRLGPCQ